MSGAHPGDGCAVPFTRIRQVAGRREVRIATRGCAAERASAQPYDGEHV
jgi:hypothetical protein